MAIKIFISIPPTFPLLNNPKLRIKDMMEWSSISIVPSDGEIVIHIPDPGFMPRSKTVRTVDVPDKTSAPGPAYQWTPRLKSMGWGSFERVFKVPAGRFWLMGIDVTP